ncbi:MAG: SDR family NAD(P)-dependent oxidoreductase [Acidimicrobiales bacterium]
MELRGKVAVVTGGGRGLGRAYALHLAGMGADVAVLDVDLRSFEAYEREAAQLTAESTAAEVQALGRRAMELEVDVGDAAAVRAAIDRVVEAWGRIDVVVCNAGGGLGTPARSRASTMDLEEFEAVLRRNLHGTVNTCEAVAPVMRRQRSGKIVTVSSQAGRRASADGGYAHYGTAKAAIVMYTRYLAQDLGPDGITVNCIAPGYISTGRLSVMFEQIGVERLSKSVALRRLGTPEDCARVVGFLASSASDYVTGALIPVDGGSVT